MFQYKGLDIIYRVSYKLYRQNAKLNKKHIEINQCLFLFD